MQAIQIYQINSLFLSSKKIEEVQTYEDFKKLKIQLLSLNSNFKKPVIVKMKQSLQNLFNLMSIVDGGKFEVKIEKLKKGKKLEIKTIFKTI